MSPQAKTQAKRSSHRNRQGFTLVEILVVVIIIAILLAMLLPAINAARDAARNSMSQNNLRQIAVAGLHYESKNRHYPPSWQSTPQNGTSTSIDGWSIHAIMLPYLEQKVIESQIDYSQSYKLAPNVVMADGTSEKLSSMRVPTYLSPAERRDEVRYDGAVPEHYPLNYAVNIGTWLVYDPVTNEGGSGVSYPDSKITAAHVYDGLSSTLFFAEVKAWQPYYRNAGQSAATLDGIDPATDYTVFCNGGSLNGGTNFQFKTNSGHTEWVDGRAHQVGFTTTFPPNFRVECTESGEVYDVDWTNWQEGKDAYAATPVTTPTYAAVTARSYFEGGVNVAMLDGSVKWVDNDINLGVWRAYGTRAGEDVIPPKDQL